MIISGIIIKNDKQFAIYQILEVNTKLRAFGEIVWDKLEKKLVKKNKNLYLLSIIV